MKIKFSGIFIISIVFLISACEKVIYFDERFLYSENPRALVHAASGDAEFPGQTMEAINYGFSILDGIEVDIQISQDNTLWLSHDSEVLDSSGKSLGDFASTEDEVIKSISDSTHNFYYTPLDSVLKAMSQMWPDKYISLDIKRPSKIYTLSSYRSIASEIIRMVEEYELEEHVLVESSSTYLLKLLNKSEYGIQTYFFCMGDFDKGVAEAKLNELTGISFKINSFDQLTDELVNLLHSSGLKIEAFYANEPEDIKRLYNYGVDFLQTDNLEYYSHIGTEE
ncbi:MAG: glycerophosphodiester phosphodiesterase [Bacteroidales bacterium]|nr:glycerophosphodiester phosphodiesterase [Bacteroidales bacterium]MBN2817491.1 glycerophosphodiester phosphodiesterase [Bacteroidales bacterium]